MGLGGLGEEKPQYQYNQATNKAIGDGFEQLSEDSRKENDANIKADIKGQQLEKEEKLVDIKKTAIVSSEENETQAYGAYKGKDSIKPAGNK